MNLNGACGWMDSECQTHSTSWSRISVGEAWNSISAVWKFPATFGGVVSLKFIAAKRPQKIRSPGMPGMQMPPGFCARNGNSFVMSLLDQRVPGFLEELMREVLQINLALWALMACSAIKVAQHAF